MFKLIEEKHKDFFFFALEKRVLETEKLESKTVPSAFSKFDSLGCCCLISLLRRASERGWQYPCQTFEAWSALETPGSRSVVQSMLMYSLPSWILYQSFSTCSYFHRVLIPTLFNVPINIWLSYYCPFTTSQNRLNFSGHPH